MIHRLATGDQAERVKIALQCNVTWQMLGRPGDINSMIKAYNINRRVITISD